MNGTLAPGDLTTPGTLTTSFNLVLGSTAKLTYRLGAAGVVGCARDKQSRRWLINRLGSR